MTSNLARRLSRLEADKPPRQKVFIWLDYGKTTEEAKAVRFPDGVPDNIDFVMIGWQEPSGEVTRASFAGLTPQDGGSYGRREG
jgi:hypothetical protein